MNLSDLIPNIEVGKRYLWKGGATEELCCGCSGLFLEGTVGMQKVVIVRGVDTLGEWACECGHTDYYPKGKPGYYEVVFKDGDK